VWIGSVIALTGDYRITSAFLLNGIFGPDGWSAEWRYWFVEAIVYIVLAAAAVLSIPLVDRIERRHPFWFAMGFVALGLLTRYGLVDVDDSRNRILSAPVVFWLFALGWAAAKSTTIWHRLCVTAVVVATVPGFFFGETRREIIVVGGLCLLVWLRSVPCPTMLSRVAGVLASASLYIYLTHFQVYLPLRDDHPWLALALSILVGILYWQAVTFVLGLRRRPGAVRTKSDRNPIASILGSNQRVAARRHVTAGRQPQSFQAGRERESERSIAWPEPIDARPRRTGPCLSCPPHPDGPGLPARPVGPPNSNG